MKEDLGYLRKWLKQAEELAVSIRSQAQKEGCLAIFTISSTAKVREKGYPFMTPTRRISHGFIGGSVVFSQTQAIILSKRIDGLVDDILVDTEKKICIHLGIDDRVLKYFGLEPPPQKGNARVNVEMGNISAACANHIRISSFHEYKPNDMTVESVWHFLSSWYRTLSGKKIAIIGSGNIGFKLALKLVESGCQIELVRRDLERGMLMANVINVTKPQSTIATAHFNPDPMQASLFSDVLIGCTNGKPAITWEMIQTMKPDGIVIDVAKGSIFKDAIRRALENEITVIRCDVSSGVDGLISTMQRNQSIISKEMGRYEIEKSVFIVSGGIMGLGDDIVVDNYRNPQSIFGVADGKGDLKNRLSEKNLCDLSIVKERIEHEEN